MAVVKTNPQVLIEWVVLAVLVAVALILFPALPQVVREYLGKVRTVVRVLAVRGGLGVAVAAHQP